MGPPSSQLPKPELWQHHWLHLLPHYVFSSLLCPISVILYLSTSFPPHCDHISTNYWYLPVQTSHLLSLALLYFICDLTELLLVLEMCHGLAFPLAFERVVLFAWKARVTPSPFLPSTYMPFPLGAFPHSIPPLDQVNCPRSAAPWCSEISFMLHLSSILQRLVQLFIFFFNV